MHNHCSASTTDGPRSRYLENEVWSKTVTPERVLACSAADHGSQFCLPHAYSICEDSPAGAKKLARSQPIRLPKPALAST